MSDAASLPGRVRWLRASRPRSTTMLELSAFCAIVGGLLLVVMHSEYVLTTRLHALDAIELAYGPRLTMSEYRAVNGTWPDSSIVDSTVEPMWQSNPIVSARLRAGGAVDVTFVTRRLPALDGRVLTFRAWQGESTDQPLLWTCGRAVPPAHVAAADDRTSVSDDWLPSFCRPRR